MGVWELTDTPVLSPTPTVMVLSPATLATPLAARSERLRLPPRLMLRLMPTSATDTTDARRGALRLTLRLIPPFCTPDMALTPTLPPLTLTLPTLTVMPVMLPPTFTDARRGKPRLRLTPSSCIALMALTPTPLVPMPTPWSTAPDPLSTPTPPPSPPTPSKLPDFR